MNALVNNLTKKDNEPAAAANPTAVSAVVAEAVADDENDEGFVGERMIDVGIDPIKASDIEAELKTIFSAHGVEYVHNPTLINDVGQRIVDELELMIRMINPESQYNPEWYNRDEDQTVLAAIIGRDDLVDVYRDSLSETHELVNEEIADGIVAYICDVVSDYESMADEHYAAAE